MTRQTPIKYLINSFTALVLLVGCSPVATLAPILTPMPPTATALPPTATLDPARQKAAIGKILQSANQAGRFSGAALVAQNGTIILSGGYGLADRSKKTPNTAQTKFRIGEMTLPFTAMAVLILQEQGKLSLQDKLCAYLKTCSNSWKDITLEELLLHTSGMPDIDFYSHEFQTPDQMLMFLADSSPLFQPGTQFSWSPWNYEALGKVIEAASGETYEAFLQKNIFTPLQMAHSGYDHGQADLAIDYPAAGDRPANLMDPQGLFSDGGLYSTVEDLNRWDQALYANQLVSAETLAAMFTPRVTIPSTSWWYGYGYAIQPSGPHVVETVSYVPGIFGICDRYPDQKVVVILLANAATNTLADLSGQITHVMIESP